jgi:hypothetical protein
MYYNCPTHGLTCGNYCARCQGAVPQYPGFYQSLPVQQQGCICPPTSEQTCQSPTCPRKNPLKGATA